MTSHLTVTRPGLARLIQFAQRLRQKEGCLFQAKEEASRLGVSKRTFKRDLQVLESFGYAFEYDQMSQLWFGKAPPETLL